MWLAVIVLRGPCCCRREENRWSVVSWEAVETTELGTIPTPGLKPPILPPPSPPRLGSTKFMVGPVMSWELKPSRECWARLPSSKGVGEVEVKTGEAV